MGATSKHPVLFRHIRTFPVIKARRGRIFKGQICSQPEPKSTARAAELGASPSLSEGCVVCAACKHPPGIREK